MRRAVRVVVDGREKGEVLRWSAKADVGQFSIKVIGELGFFFLGKFSQGIFFLMLPAPSGLGRWHVSAGRDCRADTSDVEPKAKATPSSSPRRELSIIILKNSSKIIIITMVIKLRKLKFTWRCQLKRS